MDIRQLSASEKEALILELWAQLQAAQAQAQPSQAEALASREQAQASQAEAQASQARIAELEAKVRKFEALLAKPPKTPKNSSVPPSKGHKPKKPKPRKGRPGKGRKLHPDPDRTVVARAATCPHCGADLAGTAQQPQAVYDRIELPAVRPQVTRVELHGCDCPACGERVVATPPEGLPRGSPFGESIAQLATYLRYVHAISYQRLQALFADLWGLDISQGGLANLLRRVQGRLDGTVEDITARVQSSRVVKSDETGARVDGRKAWEWVCIGAGAVLHVIAESRAKREPEAVLAGARPEVWVADPFGSQQGHGERGQVCLAHQLRDVQYAIDAGDTVFAPEMLAWLQRAIQVGQQREERDDAALEQQHEELLQSLEVLLGLEPEQADGERLRKRYAKCKEGLLVFVTDREVPFTNNESERALRPSVIFRKVTNGPRSEWGADLFAAVRSVIGTGRPNDLSPFEAIVRTLDGQSILDPA